MQQLRSSSPFFRRLRRAQLLLLAMAGITLAGAQTITIATHYTAEQLQPMQSCVEEYEAESGVDLEFQQISYVDYLQTVLTSRIGGQAPDVYHLYSIWGAQMVDNGVLAEPPADLVDWINATYVDSTVDAVTMNGQVWGVPTEVSNYMLVYNKKLLQEAGYQNPPATWSELVDMAAEITEKSSEGAITTAGFAFGPSVANVVHPFLTLLYSRGVQPFADDYSGTNLTSPEAIAVLEEQVELFRTGGTDSSVEVWDFPSGSIAMMIMAPWYESTLREAFGEEFEETVGVAPIPGGEDWRSLQYAFFYAVDANSRNKDAAWEALRALNEADGSGTPSCMGRMLFELGALTANEADIAAAGDALNDSYTRPFVDAFGRSISEPNVVQASEIEGILRTYIQRAWSGELSAEEALTQADREISNILDEFY